MTDSQDGVWKSVFFMSHTSREDSCNGVIKEAGPLPWAEQDSVKAGSVRGV